MKILGLDFGLKKIGLAITFGELAEPFGVFYIKNPPQGVEKIIEICQKEAVGKIVIGISEGKMAEKTKSFGVDLEKTSGLPVEFYDETLTTHNAQRLLITGGGSAKKRRQKEDAAAAALILQSWLDEKENKF